MALASVQQGQGCKQISPYVKDLHNMSLLTSVSKEQLGS